VPDRVLLQFGMLQHLPDPVEVVERVTMQGKADQHWPTYHDKALFSSSPKKCSPIPLKVWTHAWSIKYRYKNKLITQFG